MVKDRKRALCAVEKHGLCRTMVEKQEQSLPSSQSDESKRPGLVWAL